MRLVTVFKIPNCGTEPYMSPAPYWNQQEGGGEEGGAVEGVSPNSTNRPPEERKTGTSQEEEEEESNLCFPMFFDFFDISFFVFDSHFEKLSFCDVFGLSLFFILLILRVQVAQIVHGARRAYGPLFSCLRLRSGCDNRKQNKSGSVDVQH